MYEDIPTPPLENRVESFRAPLVPGEITERYLTQNPKLANIPEAYPSLSIFNPNRDHLILGFAGFAISHYQKYFEQSAPEFANKSNHSAAVVEWVQSY
jgi:hypothetical protein